MKRYAFVRYIGNNMNVNISDIFGENQTLKNFSSKTVNFSEDMSINMRSATQTKMYRRSIFNVAGSLNGANSWFSSCYAPNIFDVSTNVNADGIMYGKYDTDDDLFQYDEFFLPIQELFSQSIIKNILAPRDILYINKVSTADDDTQSTIVDDEGHLEKYTRRSYNKQKTYRVYFPNAYHASRKDINLDEDKTYDNKYRDRNNLNDVINQNQIYKLSLSCNDKIYTLNATSYS